MPVVQAVTPYAIALDPAWVERFGLHVNAFAAHVARLQRRSMLASLLPLLPLLLNMLKGFLPDSWNPETKETIIEKVLLALDNITNPERREVEMRVAIAELQAGKVPSILRGAGE